MKIGGMLSKAEALWISGHDTPTADVLTSGCGKEYKKPLKCCRCSPNYWEDLDNLHVCHYRGQGLQFESSMTGILLYFAPLAQYIWNRFLLCMKGVSIYMH